MIKSNIFKGLLIAIFIFTGCLNTSIIYCGNYSDTEGTLSLSIQSDTAVTLNDISVRVEKLNRELKRLLTFGKFSECKPVVNNIIKEIDKTNVNVQTLSESNYLIGVFNILTSNYKDALHFLTLSKSVKESNNELDIIYANTLYNLGIIYGRLGDFKRHEDYSLRALEIEKSIYGKSNPALISTYSSLAIAYIELQEYEKSLFFANLALNLADNNQEAVDPLHLADLYNNLGVINIRIADYTKAKLFLEKSESLYKMVNLSKDDNYLNMINNLAIAYGALNLVEKSEESYSKGITLASSINSMVSYNLVNSYAIILGNSGKPKKGEFLLVSALERAESKYGKNSRIYIEVLNNYAEYLREYHIDNSKSIECYLNCITYLENNRQEISLKDPIYLGYSISLSEAGHSRKALEIIQSLLFSDWQRNNIR